MTQAMIPSSPSISDTGPAPRGLSDEEELKRWAQASAEAPVGEVMVDFSSELEELGFKAEAE
jgi:hypothetical protein